MSSVTLSQQFERGLDYDGKLLVETLKPVLSQVTLTRALIPQQELTTDGRNLGKKDIFLKSKKNINKAKT